MKNKPDPALLQTSYLFKEIKKDAKISWDYSFHLHIFGNFIYIIEYYNILLLRMIVFTKRKNKTTIHTG
jgi:hypothetical protein